FYVSDISISNNVGTILDQETIDNEEKMKVEEDASDYFMDFANNSTVSENFPFSTWNKLLRETMSDDRHNLMVKAPSIGIYQLRLAIKNYLFQFRGMVVEPEQIVVGAGTEYLYGLIIQLLGFDKIYGVEEPGYQKISRIYRANKV